MVLALDVPGKLSNMFWQYHMCICGYITYIYIYIYIYIDRRYIPAIMLYGYVHMYVKVKGCIETTNLDIPKTYICIYAYSCI